MKQNTPSATPADQTQSQAVVQPATSVAPAGAVNKEVEPVGASVSELAKPSETEPQISQELKELGIEAKKDTPDVGDEHKGIIEHAKQFTPVPSSPSGKITMPMSEKEIEDKLKTGRSDDSGKWLAGLIRKIIRAMGF